MWWTEYYFKKYTVALKSHSNMSPLDLKFHVEWTIPMQVKLKEKPFQTDPDPLSSWEHQHSCLRPALLLNTDDLCCLSTKHIANNRRAQEQRRCNLDYFTESEWSACLWRLTAVWLRCKDCISVARIGITYGFGREFPSSRDDSGRCSAPHIHLHLNTSADTQLEKQKRREKPHQTIKQGSNHWTTLSKVWFCYIIQVELL